MHKGCARRLAGALLCAVLAAASPAAANLSSRVTDNTTAALPEAPPWDLNVAQVAIDAGNYETAIAKLQAILGEYPESAEANIRLGYVHRRLQNFTEAFAYYQRALEIAPRHTGAHQYIGEAYLEIGDLETAEYHLAQLSDICEYGCDDYWQLHEAVALYRANNGG